MNCRGIVFVTDGRLVADWVTESDIQFLPEALDGDFRFLQPVRAYAAGVRKNEQQAQYC